MNVSKTLLEQAVLRALRTFVQAFLVIYPGSALIGWATGQVSLDTNMLKAAAISGAIAALSFLWRFFLDPSRVPSMIDTPTNQ